MAVHHLEAADDEQTRLEGGQSGAKVLQRAERRIVVVVVQDEAIGTRRDEGTPTIARFVLDDQVDVVVVDGRTDDANVGRQFGAKSGKQSMI